MKQEPKGISLNFLSKFYDCLTFTEKSRFRKHQIGLMDIRKGEKVLDVGCGTGALAILARIAVGESGEVDGIDIAPKMIATAQQKARKSNLKINFTIASVNELPYPDNSFDLVISSLMFHHLPVKVKKEGLEEIHRVFKKEGRLFLSDFGSPHILTFPLMYLILLWISSTRYQLFGRLPKLINECNFNHVELRKKGLFLEYYLISKN